MDDQEFQGEYKENSRRNQSDETISLENKANLRNDKYQAIFDFSPDPIVILNRMGTITDCNSRIYDFIGWKPDEMIGLNIMSMPQLTSSSKSKAIINFRKRVKGEEIAPYPLEFRNRDGQLKIGKISGRAFFDDSGKNDGEIIFIEDITEMVKKDHIIHESESKFKSLADSTVAAIFILSGENIVYINEGGKRLTGYSEEDLKSTDFISFIHPEHRAMVLERSRKRLSGEKVPNHYQFKIFSKNGDILWLDFTASIIEYKGEKSILATAFDITEQKSIEDELRSNEGRFRQIFEEAQIGLYRSTPEGDIIMANQAFFNLLGYKSIEDFKRIDFEKEGYTEPGTRDLFMKLVNNQGYIKNFENAWKRHDGRIVYIRETGRSVKDENGNVLFFEGTVEDVSEKHEAEMELVKERRFLNFLMDHVPNHVYFKDLESRFIKVSKSLIKKHHFTSLDEVLGKTDFDVFADEHAAEAFEDEQEIIRTGTPVYGKLEKETWNDGRVTWVSTNKMPLYDEKGKIIGTFGMSSDITALMEATDQIKKMNEELKNSNHSKDKFFSILAHDLKSPFTALLGYSEFLVEDFDELDKDEIMEFANNIHKVAQNIFSLLENLLDWSRIQSGRIECTPENIIVTDVVEKVVSLFSDSAESKKIQLIDNTEPNIHVSADLNMLFTILRNLTSNAIKFTKEGGFIKFISKVEENKVLITVEDSGVGMDEKALSKLFDSKHQYTTTGTNSEQGTGLGLSLCKEMVKMNGGDIVVESEKGKGSKFIFNLPLAIQE